MSDPNAFFTHLAKMIVPFLPVLFGAVEYLKKRLKLSGVKVELIAMALFAVYGAIAILAHFFPTWGVYLLGGAVFMLACLLAPSGFYNFVNARTDKKANTVKNP